MGLPPDVIELLQDEAYLTLCGETLRDALSHAMADKEQVASTRPPFGGLFAANKTKQSFEQSMRTVENTEAALKSRISKVEVLESWLKPELRAKLHQYLWSDSADYNRSSNILAVIDEWEQLLKPYTELLTAYARELRNVVQAHESVNNNSREAFEARLHVFAELHLCTENLDRAAAMLEGVAAKLDNTTNSTIYSEVRVGRAPLTQQTNWSHRLARLINVEIVTSAQAMHDDVRNCLTQDIPKLHEQAAAARKTVAISTHNYLEGYWNQLRAHAQAHYVEERDVDEVLEYLNDRYIAADIARRKEVIGSGRDPFAFEH